MGYTAVMQFLGKFSKIKLIIRKSRNRKGDYAPFGVIFTIFSLITNGILLDIAVLNHIIVGNEQYYSFADEGIL
jgi:transposase